MGVARLSEASYIVLGMLEQIEPATPYDLKRMAQMSTANFWSVPHTQLYTECARLAHAGMLSERREQTGRRRRIYRLTDSGRDALRAWLADPAAAPFELRDGAILKLFFGADPAPLARSQLSAHEQTLASYEEVAARLPEQPRGWRLAIEAGIGHEREFVRFWSRLLDPEHRG